MRTTLLLLFIVLGFALGLQLAPAWAFTTDQQEDICASPDVLMCENFEDRALGLANSVLGSSKFKNSGWSVSDTSMSITSAQAFDGSKSLQWTLGENRGAGFLDSRFDPTRTVYYRWYTKNSLNWKWSKNGNKLVFFLNPAGRIIMLDQGLFGGSTPGFLIDDPVISGPIRFPNVGPGFSWPTDGRWVCMEMKITPNSTVPAGTDGEVQGWINGVLSYNYPNMRIDSVSIYNSAIMPSGYWNCKTGAHPNCDYTDPDNQHPTMQRWMDNIVVSTQRIGCLGAPIAGDTSPPVAPVGLRIN